MGGEAVGAICCGFLVVVPIYLLIFAAILRGGVSFANRCLPSDVEREYEDDWDDEDADRPRRRAAPLISEPSFGKAMGIVFVSLIVNIIINIPINLAVGIGLGNLGGGQRDPVMGLIAALIQLPIDFLANAAVRTGMLPTSFARACLVVLFEYLIILVICLVIGVPLVALIFALSR